MRNIWFMILILSVSLPGCQRLNDLWRVLYFPEKSFYDLDAYLLRLKRYPHIKITKQRIDRSKKLLSDRDKSDNYWYSSFLSKMNEPVLYKIKLLENSEVFRFLWFRSFNRPVAIRVSKSDQSITLIAKVLSGAGAYRTRKLINTVIKTLKEKDWRDIQALVKASKFWSMRTVTYEIGFDGAHWILEGRNPKEYHVVMRWSPRDKHFAKLCLHLLKLSGLNEKPVY
ncbi:MAG: hypothetical protein OEZ36_00660 [Spirochaetota bacterium]|nr:hypothetical protein [Spirochaetota bacterium]